MLYAGPGILPGFDSVCVIFTASFINIIYTFLNTSYKIPASLSTIIFLAALYIMGRAHPSLQPVAYAFFLFKEIFLVK